MNFETENIEFKSGFTEEIYKEVIAFANTDGGVLYIGIDNDGNSISFDDILGTDPDDILNILSLKIQVSQLLRSLDKVLTDREKQIVLMRYGIKGCESKTQREIAAELGISRSYVSRIEKKALQKLNDYLKVSAI